MLLLTCRTEAVDSEKNGPLLPKGGTVKLQGYTQGSNKGRNTAGKGSKIHMYLSSEGPLGLPWTVQAKDHVSWKTEAQPVCAQINLWTRSQDRSGRD